MFKKTVAILFLFSQVWASSSSSPKVFKSNKKSPKFFAAKEVTPKLSMSLRSSRKSKPSPLGVNEVSSAQNNLSDSIEGGKVAATELIHFVSEAAEEEVDFDSFELDEEFFEKSILLSSENKPLNERFIEAIRADDLNSVKELVKENFDLNSLENCPRTPFMLALQAKNPEIVNFLLKTGKVDPNIFGTDGCDVLSLAAENFGTRVAQKILKSEIKLKVHSAFNILVNLKQRSSPHFLPIATVMAKTRDFSIFTALVVISKDAVLANETFLIRFLHSLGVPMTKKYRGLCFIHYAAIRGYPEMVNLLLELGSHIDVLTDNTNLSPLQVAFYNREYGVVVELIKKGASYGLVECISTAVMESNLQIIHGLLSAYANLTNFNLQDGFNLVTLSIAADKPDILKMVLESGKVNQIVGDYYGRTIYNMELDESVSEELKTIIQEERLAADQLAEFLNI